MIEFIISFIVAIISGNGTTFYYEVTSPASPAISHVTYELCQSAIVLDAGVYDPSTLVLKPRPYELGLDPTTGLYGIKFDEGLDVGKTEYYYFTLEDSWATLTTTVGIKAGQQVTTTLVPGPGLTDSLCNPTSITILEASASPNTRLSDVLFFSGVFLSLGLGTLFAYKCRGQR